MALTVEDGTGLEDAESYASVSDADAYFTARAVAGWTGTDAVKEAALRKATEFISETYDGSWKGERATDTQALAWPRSDVEVSDNVILTDDLVPVALFRATCELALIALTTALYEAANADPSTVAEKTKVGPIERERKYADPKGITNGLAIDRIAILLAPLIDHPNFVLRTVRV